MTHPVDPLKKSYLLKASPCQWYLWSFQFANADTILETSRCSHHLVTIWALSGEVTIKQDANRHHHEGRNSAKSISTSEERSRNLSTNNRASVNRPHTKVTRHQSQHQGRVTSLRTNYRALRKNGPWVAWTRCLARGSQDAGSSNLEPVVLCNSVYSQSISIRREKRKREESSVRHAGHRIWENQQQFSRLLHSFIHF